MDGAHTSDNADIDKDILQRAALFFTEQRQPAYLVGGSVRDLLLQERCTDWDIAMQGDTAKVARRLADQLGGFYAYMHEKASRVVIKRTGTQAAGREAEQETRETVLDISPLQGGSLEADLLLRDFTINAIALPLGHVPAFLEDRGNVTHPSFLPLIDPTGGANDLARRQLRVVEEDAFKRDPLRLLRAVRFMQRYQLGLDAHTEELLVRDAALLPTVAAARIHDEIYAILAPGGAGERLHFLDQHRLLSILMPEFDQARGMQQPALHHWDVLTHSIETVTALEGLTTLLQREPEEIRSSPLSIIEGKPSAAVQDDLVALSSLLREAECQGLFRFASLDTPVLKLAALLHDIGKTVTYSVDDEGDIRFYGHPQAGVPLAQAIMQRLNASTHDRRLVQQIVANHMRPGQLSHAELTPRAVRRFFLELGSAGILVALVTLADHLAMRGPEPLTEVWSRHLNTVRELLARYIRERDRVLPPRIVQPEELMRRLNLQPGPLVGQLLDAIAEAQAEGHVKSKDDAYWLAEEYLQQSNLHVERRGSSLS